MSSLRIRQKKARADQMLEAARALFVTNGYSRTSVESVAEAAGVGVATVYTYFETKEGLAAALIHKDLVQTIEEADRVAKTLPENPADAVIAIVEVFMDFKKYISADLLREFIIQSKQGGGPVNEALVWGHQEQIRSISQVLARGQRNGTVARSLNTDLAAALVVDLMDRHLSRITAMPDPKPYIGQLGDFVHLLFEDWTEARRLADA